MGKYIYKSKWQWAPSLVVAALVAVFSPLAASANEESQRILNQPTVQTQGAKNLSDKKLMLNQFESEDQSSKRYEECVRRSLHGSNKDECSANPDADACVGAVKAMQYSKLSDICAIKMQRFCLRRGHKQNTQLGWLNVARKHFENASICLNKKAGKVGTDVKRDELKAFQTLNFNASVTPNDKMGLKVAAGKRAADEGGDVGGGVDDGSASFGLENGSILRRLAQGEELSTIVGFPYADSGNGKGESDSVGESEEGDGTGLSMGSTEAGAKTGESTTPAEAIAKEKSESGSLTVNRAAPSDFSARLFASVQDYVRLGSLSDERKQDLCRQWGHLGSEAGGAVAKSRAPAAKGVTGSPTVDPVLAEADQNRGGHGGRTIFQLVHNQYLKQAPWMINDVDLWPLEQEAKN